MTVSLSQFLRPLSTLSGEAHDQIRFYNRALSEAEVQQLYAYEKSPLPFLTVAVKTIRLSMFVEPGKTYQLESSVNMQAWDPYGSPFTAIFPVIHQDVDVVDGHRFFRVYEVTTP